MSENKGRDKIQDAGTILVVIGVSIWGVYAIGKYGFGWNVTDRDYLPYHLALIIPGMLLRYYRFYVTLVKRWLVPGRKDRTS